MAKNWGGVGLFVGGVLVGAVLAGVLVGQPRQVASVADSGPAPDVALQQAAAVAGTRGVDCSFAPIVPAASKDDGLLPLDKDLQGNSPAAVATLILTGKEAAAAGKPRDAETAFLMACRSAESVKNDAVPLADAQYQLGRHYAQLATPPDAPQRAELLRRAEALYASSLQAYQQHRGADHEKTRFAQEGLAALRRLTSAPPPAATTVPGTAEEEARAMANTGVMGAAPQAPTSAVPEPAVAPPVAKAEPPKPAANPAAEMAPKPAAETAPKREAKAESKAEVKAASKPEAKADSQVEAKVETRPEPKPESRPATRRAEREEPAEVTAAPSTPLPPRPVRRTPPPVVPVPAPEPVPAAPEPAPPVPEPAPIVVAPEPAVPAPPVEVISEPPATASGSAAIE